VKDKKLNILFLSGWYPNRVAPTLGNFVQKHAEAVAMHSNVIVLNVCADRSCKETVEVAESWLNNVYTINVYYKKVDHNIPVLSQFQKLIRITRAYQLGINIALTKLERIDLVHHNILFPSGIVAFLIKKKYKIPYIITEHSTRYLPLKNIKIGAIERFISSKVASAAGFITPVSDDLKTAMIQKGINGNYKIVYNVVDTKVFHPTLNQTTSSKIKFLHISTLDDAQKNISGMLRATAELSKTRHDFECYFIGDGDTSPHKQTAKELNILDSFAFFEGTKTTAQIAELMRNAHCFLLFSNYENLPVVIIEAFATGLPVVSSNVGGIAEHLNEERGILVRKGDEKTLLQAMNQMIDAVKARRYNNEDIARYAANHFSYEAISENFHDLYHQTLTRHV
jgi:glycosyltransferase involved in cell wall biosynthesis